MGKTASLANIGTIADSSLGFRNRIINGAMVINQRAAGIVNSDPAVNPYIVDRFRAVQSAGSAGAFSSQQSTTAPTGFTNSFLTTALVATSFSATLYHAIRQPIEGFNCADLMWGTASASSITLSFWVRSSLTGTFGGAIGNQSGSRSYPFTFAISAANTFEYKTVTITGDTTGTWPTDNSGSINVWFSLGAGSDRKGTAGAWNANFNTSATGAVDVNATSGATFYITGVQLEKGSTATSFDYRPYSTELQLAQRYYSVTQAITFTSLTQIPTVFFPVTMRATPTIGTVTFSGGTGATYTSIGTISVYQSGSHSAQQTATIPLSAEL